MSAARPEPSPLCGIPGHPATGHGGHPGCIVHGDMQYQPETATWVCLGEGCDLPPVPDHYAHPRG